MDETLPDQLKSFLKEGGKVEEIRLDAEGRWSHQGEPFLNKRIIRLFNRSITRTEGGTWLLVVGSFAHPIQVDDTAFFVESIQLEKNGCVLKLSDETTERLDPGTVAYRPTGRLYCRIKNARFKARFKRGVYHSLAELMVEVDGRAYLDLPTGRVFLADLVEES